MFNTNSCFTKGKLTIILDAQAGSSGKGKLGSFVTAHANNWQFCCNTFLPQAGHWVRLDDGRHFFYQTLNSCAYQHERFEKMYIGPGATIELPALWRELEENGVPRRKLGISPITSILQDIDGGYERGTHDFSGNNMNVLCGTELVSNEELSFNNGVITGILRRAPVVGTIVISVCSRLPLSGVLPPVVLVRVTFRPDGCAILGDGTVIGYINYNSREVSIDIGDRWSEAQSAIADYEISRSNDQASGGPLVATGSTAHGCGANRARRVLRRPEAKYARNIPELKEFLCDVPGEIMDRLDHGQSGLLEVAQGFQLSYMLPDMFPFTTSRNVTVAAGLDDMMIPPLYAGKVILNLRTFPIRINSNKYLDKVSGRHLTWDEYQNAVCIATNAVSARLFAPDSSHRSEDIDTFLAEVNKTVAQMVKVVQGNSGPGYPDQQETTWDEVTRASGSPAPITEITSVTKLPRRVFTFSRTNLDQAVKHNRTGHDLCLAVNFMNYVDHGIAGLRVGNRTVPIMSDKVKDWLKTNLGAHLPRLMCIGTGPNTDDQIMFDSGSCPV